MSRGMILITLTVRSSNSEGEDHKLEHVDYSSIVLRITMNVVKIPVSPPIIYSIRSIT